MGLHPRGTGQMSPSLMVPLKDAAATTLTTTALTVAGHLWIGLLLQMVDEKVG